MKRLFIAAIISLLIGSDSIAQRYETALGKWAAEMPAEKTYLHTDQEYYVPGETIWFKAYLFHDGQPSSLSYNMHIQFTDAESRIIDQKMYPVTGSTARGEIFIPDSLPAGNYFMRVFTPGMLNQDPEFIYAKRIPILRPASNEAVTMSEAPSFQFFPESGRLIEGIPTLLAFKATDASGHPLDVKGIIRVASGETITTFKSLHDGMGHVLFIPQAGIKYEAETEIAGEKKIFSIPQVETIGVNLHIADEKDGKMFVLSRSEKNKDQFEKLTLVAQINNRIVFENEIQFDEYLSVKGHLLTNEMPSGILHFTVFDKKGLPLAERLSFVNNGEYISKVKMETVKKGLAKRGETIIEMSFEDLIQRSCSISVTDVSPERSNDRETIYSRFLLTGDLKGYVHNPSWYFNNTSNILIEAMDNLMLTHGWSRFNWQKVLAGDMPKKKVEDHSLISVAGDVMDPRQKEKYENGTLKFYLEAEDSTTQTFTIDVGKNGRFRMDSLFFFGKTKFYYAYSGKNDNSQVARIIPITDPVLESIKGYPFFKVAGILSRLPVPGDLLNRNLNAISNAQGIKEMEAVIVQSRSKPIRQVLNEKYATGVFRDQSKVMLDNINEPTTDKALNALDYIRNRIPQLEMQGGRLVNRKNFSLQTGLKWPVGIFVDEIPTDLSSLRMMRAVDIAMVKFWETGFVGVGQAASGGAVAIYTKEQTDKVERPAKLEHFVYNGYSVAKEFYVPPYDAKDFKQPAIDNRVTLFWDSDVFYDASTKSMQFKFYNNDSGKKMRVTVEGFDGNGKLIYLEKVIGE